MTPLRSAVRVLCGRMRQTAFDIAVNRIGGSALLGRRVRRATYRMCGMAIRTIRVSPGCYFTSPAVTIGESSFVNVGCFFDCAGGVSIGERCSIAMRAMFVTSDHEIGTTAKRAGQVVHRPIRIGDGCWIGAGVTVLPGVTVGEGCIVGAGAVVATDCQPNGLYAGVPARRLRELT